MNLHGQVDIDVNNKDAALKYFLLSAKQGNADAQYHLGDLNFQHKEQNNEAYIWYTLAIANGSEWSEYAIESLKFIRMSDEERINAKVEALKRFTSSEKD